MNCFKISGIFLLCLISLFQQTGTAKDTNGKINFPYLNFKSAKKDIQKTTHSLSFCCTLLTNALLSQYDFQSLSAEKHWYDVSISRKSIQLGLNNYLLVNHRVLHKPHSSRPWKQLKYNNPIKYYYQKLHQNMQEYPINRENIKYLVESVLVNQTMYVLKVT